MSMNPDRDVLRRLEVVSPCTVTWDSMRGDDNIRFCGECRLNVYNLSGMSTRDALSLVARREHRVCVRFYRRPDGTVVTQDCGSAARRAARLMFGAICTFIALVIAGTAAGYETWMTEVRWPWKGQLSLQGELELEEPALTGLAARPMPTVAPPEPPGESFAAPPPTLDNVLVMGGIRPVSPPTRPRLRRHK